jgi:carbon monoxide dehydrogenase subunit G
MMKSILEYVVAIVFVATPMLASSAPSTGRDIIVHATKDGAAFTVDAELTVAANVDEVWEVLTDFDRMAQIVTSIDSSRIVSRDGNMIQVAQKSHANAGPLRFSMENLRQVELIPNREMRSHLLKGDLKASDFTTRISDEGGGLTKITVQGKFVAGGVSGGVITVESVEAQTRRQYQELRDEILRRKANEPPPPCLIAKTCPQNPG